MTDSIRTIRRKACDALIDSLNREPDMWRWSSDNQITIKHKNGVEIWYSCGSAYLYSPRKVEFSWLSWFRLRRALKNWHRKTGLAQVNASEVQACMAAMQMFAKGQIA